MAADVKRNKEGTLVTTKKLMAKECNNGVNRNCQNEFEVVRRLQEVDITRKMYERNLLQLENSVQKFKEKRKSDMTKRQWLLKTWKC